MPSLLKHLRAVSRPCEEGSRSIQLLPQSLETTPAMCRYARTLRVPEYSSGRKDRSSKPSPCGQNLLQPSNDDQSAFSASWLPTRLQEQKLLLNNNMTGTSPKPTIPKLVQGNSGKRKPSRSEPQFSGSPECPVGSHHRQNLNEPA
jgi:hypothetical protein